ncbi:MAG: ABC transporter ATP-binding protein [Cyclobacteriaceae bacterium]
MLIAENLHKSYGSLKVLNEINLEITESEVVSIVGASGAGKSTLLHLLGTLDTPDSGSVTMNGQLISGMSAKQLAKFRNKHIGFIFQFHNLLPEFTALENVAMPGFIMGRKQKEVLERADYLLNMLGLKNRETHKPSELSGGEQQRVAVARALINEPEIVFADEPSGNLDSKNAEDLHQLFFKVRQEIKSSFVVVTHNDDLADMADRKFIMKDGQIIDSVTKPAKM